jgi:hypothetical protein
MYCCAGGALLKVTRWFLLLALVGFTASTAMADGIDPVFKIRKGPLSTPVTNGHFSFTADNTQGTTNVDFALDFVNQSGFTAQSLTLTFIVSKGLTISVDNTGDPFFLHANLITPSETGGVFTINFFGTDETHPGIFSQDCSGGDGDTDDCVGGGADFIIDILTVPPGGFISGTGSLLPEPSTGLSLALGMAGMALALRKMRVV